MKTTDYHTLESKCPHCGHRFDRALGGADGGTRRPRFGDATLCIRCGEIGIFEENDHVRKPTEEERREVLQLENVVQTQLLIKNREP